MKPAGLFDPIGRKRLAALIVWGANGRRLTRHQIEQRLEKVLERIAAKVAGKTPMKKAA